MKSWSFSQRSDISLFQTRPEIYQSIPLRRSRSQKQRLALWRQVAWRRDQQRRKRPLRRGHKRFSYRLVCTSSAISILSSRFHSFSFISSHFHISSIFHFHFHFHFHFQCTPRSDINQWINHIKDDYRFRSKPRPKAKSGAKKTGGLKKGTAAKKKTSPGARKCFSIA